MSSKASTRLLALPVETLERRPLPRDLAEDGLALRRVRRDAVAARDGWKRIHSRRAPDRDAVKARAARAVACGTLAS